MKLKTTQIKDYREAQTRLQNNCCALCKVPFEPNDRIVLDHNHTTGHIRGSIHSACNLVLGKLENSAKRYGVDLTVFIQGVQEYKDRQLPELHPTYYTPEEKVERAKAKAKRRYKKRKQDK